jgi:GTP-binding protein
VTDQDAQILSYACQRGKAVMLAINKWDLVAQGKGDTEDYRKEVYYKLAFLEHAPVSFISAATGFGIRKMLENATLVMKNYRAKIRTSALNEALQTIVKAHPAPQFQGRAVKFYYGTQTATRPPTFTLFVNFPGAVGESYQRYLVHQLRASLGLAFAPIKLLLRARREEPRKKRR